MTLSFCCGWFGLFQFMLAIAPLCRSLMLFLRRIEFASVSCNEILYSLFFYTIFLRWSQFAELARTATFIRLERQQCCIILVNYIRAKNCPSDAYIYKLLNSMGIKVIYDWQWISKCYRPILLRLFSGEFSRGYVRQLWVIRSKIYMLPQLCSVVWQFNNSYRLHMCNVNVYVCVCAWDCVCIHSGLFEWNW